MIIRDLHTSYTTSETSHEMAYLSYRNGKLEKETSAREIVTEHRIAVFVNDQLVAHLVCTPTDLAELVTGRLLTEQIILSTDEVREIYICEKASRARVFLHDHEKKLNPFIEQSPTCCSDNHVYMQAQTQEEPEPFTDTVWDPEEIIKIGAEIRKGEELYRSTFGVHAAFLIHNGTIAFRCVDIGRHNAVDKAIGYAAIQGLDSKECMLYSTGRASSDMVRKSVRAGIPAFLSKKTTTSAAVEMAQKYHLTLICNIREDNFNLFSSVDFTG